MRRRNPNMIPPRARARKRMESTGTSFGQAIKNKIKSAGDAIKRADENYKNRKDDSNKYRSVFYWKDNTN